MAARRLRIHGRVQGVFYRNWTVQTARSLGLSGWVRNRSDGTVEAVVAGSAADIKRFISLAHDGPPAANVNRIDERDEDERSEEHTYETKSLMRISYAAFCLQ